MTGTAGTAFALRKARPEDAAVLAGLFLQLGYETPAQVVADRLGDPAARVLAAVADAHRFYGRLGYREHRTRFLEPLAR